MIVVPGPLSARDYEPYGDVLSADREDVVSREANQGTAARQDHLIDLQHTRHRARANFSSFRCAPRTEWPMPIVLLEKHPHSTQAFVPMGVRRYLAVVALGGDAPDLRTLRAFVAPGNAAISYRPGVWHHPMIALDAVSDFACLVWEEGSTEDAIVHSLVGPRVSLESPAPPSKEARS